MDQRNAGIPREATMAIMSDVVLYGQAVTITVMTIDENGAPTSSWARVSPPCLLVLDGVPSIVHSSSCGCAALQPVVTG